MLHFCHGPSALQRFVDDLFAVHNPLLSALLYTSQQLGPIRGIYDPELNLAPASSTEPGLHLANYLDLQFIPSRQASGAIRLHVKLYGERLEDKFVRMMLQRYPHATSALSSMCKLNIIVSRYTHMRRVITVKEDFCWHLARMMFDFYRRDYRMRPMWKRLERCLRWQPAFKSTQWYTLYRVTQCIFRAAKDSNRFDWAPVDTTATAAALC